MNNSTKSLIATVAGFLALGLFIVGLIYWAALSPTPFNFNIGEWDWMLRILMIGAIVAFSVFLIISPESVGTAVSKRSTRLTANALVVSLIAVAIGIVINVLFGSVQSARADLTAGKDFSLSEQTTKVLEAVDKRGKDVTAVAFYSDRAPQGVSRQQIEDLLVEYDSRSSHLKYEFVDPYVAPARARELGATRLGTVIFDDGVKREEASSVTEADFTSALARLLSTEVRSVAFVTGHGERSPDDYNEQSYQTVRAAIERENYKISTVNLTISPTLTLSDATVLVIGAPTKAYTEKELQTVQTYLDSGGKAMVLLDPTMPSDVITGMQTLLTKYNIGIEQGVAVDVAKSASPQEPTIVLVNTYSPNDVTRDLSSLSAVTAFPEAMALKPPTSTTGSFVVTQLIQTSPGENISWLETDPQTQGWKYDAGKDIAGPVSLGLTVAPAASGTATDTTQPKTRLVVFSDADFASNYWVAQAPANTDLFANSISWLAGANELVSIRAKDPTAPRLITLDVGQRNLLFTAAVLLLPAAVLIAGGFNWWRRR